MTPYIRGTKLARGTSSVVSRMCRRTRRSCFNPSIRVENAMRKRRIQGAQVRFGKHRGAHGDEPIELRRAFRQLMYGADGCGMVQFHRLRTLRKNLPQIGEIRILQFLPGRRRIQHRNRGTEHVAVPQLLAHAQHAPTCVSSLMENDGSFSRRDTVLCDTPARSATSLSVAMTSSPQTLVKGFTTA